MRIMVFLLLVLILVFPRVGFPGYLWDHRVEQEEERYPSRESKSADRLPAIPASRQDAEDRPYSEECDGRLIDKFSSQSQLCR
jgi:hypothetical protein